MGANIQTEVRKVSAINRDRRRRVRKTAVPRRNWLANPASGKQMGMLTPRHYEMQPEWEIPDKLSRQTGGHYDGGVCHFVFGSFCAAIKRRFRP